MASKGENSMGTAKTPFKSMPPLRRVRYMPFALTPPEMRKNVENGTQTKSHDDGIQSATLTKRIDNPVKSGMQTEAHENATLTEKIDISVEDGSLPFLKWVIQLDHPYATTKPFSCKYCLIKFNHKDNRDKHTAICTARQTFDSIDSDDDEENLFEHNQKLYACRVCAKQYPYDKMRKHYLQFINSDGTRENRYGHGEVSLSTHISYMNELKANKHSAKKKY